jgi:hypothetical protein
MVICTWHLSYCVCCVFSLFNIGTDYHYLFFSTSSSARSTESHALQAAKEQENKAFRDALGIKEEGWKEGAAFDFEEKEKQRLARKAEQVINFVLILVTVFSSPNQVFIRPLVSETCIGF